MCNATFAACVRGGTYLSEDPAEARVAGLDGDVRTVTEAQFLELVGGWCDTDLQTCLHSARHGSLRVSGNSIVGQWQGLG